MTRVQRVRGRRGETKKRVEVKGQETAGLVGVGLLVSLCGDGHGFGLRSLGVGLLGLLSVLPFGGEGRGGRGVRRQHVQRTR